MLQRHEAVDQSLIPRCYQSRGVSSMPQSEMRWSPPDD
jgi:hypothetical protein